LCRSLTILTARSVRGFRPCIEADGVVDQDPYVSADG
jgi:hypothetical protein